MGLFDKLFGKKEVTQPEPVVAKVKKPRKPKEKKVEPAQKELSAKEKASKEGEPYINIVSLELDPNNINNGAFELDWNEIFIARLVKSGYMMKKEDKDSDIVDRWFQDVCRNVALEVYEQEIADPEKRKDIRIIQQRDLGDGRTEVS